MSVEVYEPVQLIVDNLVLQGTEANLVSTNAVSKAYVDSHISSAVSALVNSAPATLDTLKEIATALNNDANLATTLTNSIGSEATARIAGDATLLADINKKVTDVGSWAGNLVHVEQVARIAGDAEESKRAMAAESKEATDRAFVDAGLQAQIIELSGSSGSSASSLQSQIEAEVTARITEDGMINQRISDEIINREGAVYQVSDTLVQTSSALNMRCDALDYSVTALGDNKFNSSGGALSGDVKLVDSYLNFGDSWRVKASGDGLRIVFEHLKNGVWRTALPFICSA
jgi:hypothetical protein